MALAVHRVVGRVVLGHLQGWEWRADRGTEGDAVTVSELIEKLQAIHGDSDLRIVGIQIWAGDSKRIVGIDAVVLQRGLAVLQATRRTLGWW